MGFGPKVSVLKRVRQFPGATEQCPALTILAVRVIDYLAGN
jgi:hypothetical protein